MRVGVEGGRGFIGAHCTRALAAAGHDTVAWGREGTAGSGFDAILWAGGHRASGDAAGLEPAHVAAPLAALARVRGGGRFVYLSSGEVYGPLPVPFREDDVPDPRTPYARAKRRGEEALGEAAARAGVTLTVLRLAVIFGPGQTGTMLLPSLLAALRAGRRLAMTAGEQTRDFLHADDLAALVVRALADGAPGGLFNAATGIETRVAEVALALARHMAGDRGAALLGLGELPYRDGEQMRYALDPTRTRARLGFAPAIALADGLRRLAGTPSTAV